MSTNPCHDGCDIQLDQEMIEELYDLFITKIKIILKEDLDANRINGPTYADTFAKLTAPLISSILSSAVAVATKETAMDRKVKQEQIDASKIDSQNKTCMATADCDLKQAQENEIPIESGRRDDTTEEQITASQADTTNKTCMATADCGLKDSQKAKFDFEVSNILPEQENLTKRQIIGFDDNKFIKGFNAGMSGWALGFSSGLMGTPDDGTGFPAFITSDELSTTYAELMTDTTIT